MAQAGADGSIRLTTQVDTGGITSFTKGLKKLATAIGVTLSVRAFAQFSKAAGEMATQTEASVKRINDIYGSASKAVGDFIDANSHALGMSKSAAASYASVYGNLFSVWADQATNANLTNHYLNMTAVVASKTGRTVEDVQERIRSGLLGNTEAIEDLGIFVNVKTIEMTDAFQRMADGKSWEQLDAYTQQQIRSMAILEQSTAKYGDEVADTTALTRAQFDAAYEDFQATWGQVVNRILMPIMQWATKALTYLNGVLQGLFNISSETVKQAESTSETTDNQKQLNSELKKTEKAQKKTLAGFDEINILSADTAENTAESGATSQLEVPEFDAGMSIDTSTLEEGRKLGEDIRDAFSPIAGIFGEINAKLGDMAPLVWAVVAAFGGFLIIKLVTSLFTKFKKPLNTVSAGFGNFLEKLGTSVEAIAFLGGLALAISAIANLIEVIAESELSLVEISGSLAAVLVLIVGTIIALTSAATTLGTNPMALLAVITVAAALDLVLIGLAATLPTILDAFSKFIVKTAPSFCAIVDVILTKVGELVKIFGTILPPIINAVGSLFANVGKAISGVFSSIAGLVERVLSAIINFVNEAGPAINTFVDNIIVAVTKLINFMISGIEYLVNTLVIGGVNGIIGGINKIGKYVGFTIPKLPKFDLPTFIPNIPALAQGAVIPPNREFLAVLGDQKSGTNIEAPLQTIVDAFNMALDRRGGANGGNTEVVLEIDGREFGRAVVEQGNRENRRIGTKLVIV